MIWAFSFGLIGSRLSEVDSVFVATLRLCLASLLLLPFLKLGDLSKRDLRRLPLYGAIQFGLMYVAYIQAFEYLPSYLVALFSVLTPVYVVLFHDLRHRSWSPRYFFAALLSVGGAAFIRAASPSDHEIWIGFLLMQLAGVSFAFGQVAYRDWKRQRPHIADQDCFFLLYAGGLAFALISSLFLTDWRALPTDKGQWLALLYLGLVASGCGFFFWNKGAAQVTPGVLGAYNNAVVPLAIFFSLFLFGEASEFTFEACGRLIGGSGLVLSAVWVGQDGRAC